MTTRTDELSIDSLSPVQLDRLIDATVSFSAAMKARGRSYAANSRVGPLLFQRDAIGARVRGSRLYEVWWSWEEGLWEATCTCPVGYECKHQYAVLCCILEPLRHVPPFHQRLAKRLPDRPATTARLLTHPDPRNRPAADGPARPRHANEVLDEDAFEEAAEDDDATPSAPSRQPRWKAPRPSLPARPRGLGELRAARDLWSRTSALQRLFMEKSHNPIALYASPFREILAEPDFEIMCWRLARVIPAHTEGWLPPALQPYREREDLRERHVQRVRQNLAARLTEWSAQRISKPDRRLRFVLGLGRGSYGLSALTIEARLTSRKLVDQPRTLPQLQQLLREAERAPGILTPDQRELLDVYLDSVTEWSPGWRSDGITTTTIQLAGYL